MVLRAFDQSEEHLLRRFSLRDDVIDRGALDDQLRDWDAAPLVRQAIERTLIEQASGAMIPAAGAIYFLYVATQFFRESKRAGTLWFQPLTAGASGGVEPPTYQRNEAILAEFQRLFISRD
ncbi:hypothetical protein CSQ85_07195, partial [Bifidobacterium rousetti]|uniref:hypothetical protein n=1 Tax=Bifidobacterium rousetti TaxID=2045439 RepID=UPI001CC2F108